MPLSGRGSASFIRRRWRWTPTCSVPAQVINYVRQAFRANTTGAGVVIARWYDGTEPYDLSQLDTDPVDPSLPGINGQIMEASLIFEPDLPDGPGIDRFSASGVDQWLNVCV